LTALNAGRVPRVPGPSLLPAAAAAGSPGTMCAMRAPLAATLPLLAARVHR